MTCIPPALGFKLMHGREEAFGRSQALLLHSIVNHSCLWSRWDFGSGVWQLNSWMLSQPSVSHSSAAQQTQIFMISAFCALPSTLWLLLVEDRFDLRSLAICSRSPVGLALASRLNYCVPDTSSDSRLWLGFFRSMGCRALMGIWFSW